MTRVGADPGQLIEAAAGFESLASLLDSAQRNITGLLDIDWWGPDADHFRSAWSSTFRAELLRQADAIRNYAAATRRQAEQQQSTSADVSGAGSSTGSAVGSTSGAGQPTGTHSYRLQDIEAAVEVKGGRTDNGKAEWSNQAPDGPSATAATATAETPPPRPGQPGYDPLTYARWLLTPAAVKKVNETIAGSGNWSGSTSGSVEAATSFALGDRDLGLTARAGVNAGYQANATAGYSYHGAQGVALVSGGLRASAGSFGDFEMHAWKLAAASAQVAASVEAGGTGHAQVQMDLTHGIGMEAEGSAYGGAHAGAAVDVSLIGASAHAGAEFNAGWGVYGSAKAGWTNEKGLTIGLSGGFGLQLGFGANAEVSFHPGKTWDAAVASVQGAGSAAMNAAANVVNQAVNVVNQATRVANDVGVAVTATIDAMDPRHWKWPW